jgi:SnoaL-like domain
MSETDDLRATVETLAAKVRALEDQVEIMQIVAQYGPAVDSGSGEAAAALWTEEGVFDAVPHLRMRGRGDIIAMIGGAGHQGLLNGGCGHVLTVPHIVLDGDEATGRSYALQVRWDPDAARFWVYRVSANTWRWVRTPHGWRIADRVNAPLDGTEGHREMLAPPAGTAAEAAAGSAKER